MAYNVVIKPQPEKALAQISDPHRRRIRVAIDNLSRSPRPTGCIKLSGVKNGYRIRVGSYRVIYEIVDRVLIVYVVRIADRKNAYRKR